MPQESFIDDKEYVQKMFGEQARKWAEAMHLNEDTPAFQESIESFLEDVVTYCQNNELDGDISFEEAASGVFESCNKLVCPA